MNYSEWTNWNSRLELNVNNNKKEENLENSSSYVHGDKQFLDMNCNNNAQLGIHARLCLPSIFTSESVRIRQQTGYVLKVAPPQMSEQIIHLADNQSIVRIAWQLSTRSVNQNVKQFTPIWLLSYIEDNTLLQFWKMAQRSTPFHSFWGCFS